MSTKQYSVILLALAVVISIFFLGNTTFPKKKLIAEQKNSVNLTSLINETEAKFTPKQEEHFHHLEADLANATTDSAKIAANGELASFFENSVESEELAAFYFAEKVKLENSEKNLTFAANLILKNCINDDGNFLKKGFRANIAKQLFEKALLLNPNKDSLQIGLGGCYMFGAGGDNPMEGISKVLGALQKDSTNAYAHKMLGFGNLQNGQTEKAVDRFIKAYNYNTADEGLIPYIALLTKKLGNATLSKEWYNKAKALFSNDVKMQEAFDKEYNDIK